MTSLRLVVLAATGVSIAILPGCGGAALSVAHATMAPPTTAALAPAEPFKLTTHCGVVSIVLDGRTLYPVVPTGIPASLRLPNPVDNGTLQLIAPDLAVFRDSSGNEIHFVDHPPAMLGLAYPTYVTIDVGAPVTLAFNGQIWSAPRPPVGVVLPTPDPSGRDVTTSVAGTVTLMTVSRLDLHTAGGDVDLTPIGNPGCD
jgi:hypothetical protein